nr:unnamed protein product [Spirometra erinaceieuropaei]
MTNSNCVLKATEGLTGFRNLANDFVIDFGAAGEGTAQVREFLHHLQLGSVHADLWRIVRRGCVGWQLMHNHRHLRVGDQTEVLVGGGEEVHSPLHVVFRGSVEGSVAYEEKFVNGGCGYARLEVYPPVIEEVAVGSVGNADPGVFITVGVHQHGREHKTEEDGNIPASEIALLSVTRAIVELTHQLNGSFGTAEFLHDLPKSFTINCVEGFRRIHEDILGRRETLPFVAVHVPSDLLGLARRPSVLHLLQSLLNKTATLVVGYFVVVGGAVDVDFLQAILLGEQFADGGVVVVEPVLVLSACATEDSQRRRLDCVPQLTPSVLHRYVLVSGGGGGSD